MRVYIVLLGGKGVGPCQIIDGIYVTYEEADEHVTKAQVFALETGDEDSYWEILEEDMPLSRAREAMSVNG